jgi:hypothetical protein
MTLLLSNHIPELGRELEMLLRDEGRPELAHQIPSLEIIDRCRCGDDFCATIYTIQKPDGAWSEGHYTLPLGPKRGMIFVDIVNGRIAEVEILDRNELREKVLKILP